MAYCGPRGIPLSEFLNWHPDDQQAALAWQSEESLKCPRCGTADWQWEEDPNFAHAEAYVCRGCNLRGHEEKAQQKTAEHMPGLHVRLIPREVAAGGEQEH